jgi:zinc protease
VRGKTWVLRKDTLSTAISIGANLGVRRGDPDYHALLFIASHIGEHRQFTGLLMNELRERRGMNYGDYAYAEHFEQEGYTTYGRTNVGRAQQDFSIWLRPVEPQNAVFATRGALYFLQRLLEEGISQERLDFVRGFLTGYTRLWEQTDQRRLGYAIDDRYFGTDNALEEFRQAIAKLTPAEVKAVANRHLSLDRLNFVYVTRDAEALADLLAKQPPTPIQYPTPKAPEVLEVDKAISTQRLPMRPAAIEIKDTQQFMER